MRAAVVARGIILLGLLVAVAVLARCGSDASLALACDPSAPPLDAGIFDGCRSPFDPGCESCCRMERGRCIQHSGGGIDPASGQPWYSVNGGGDCDACVACASCLAIDEHALRRLAARPECACEPGARYVDPCFAPGSCGCWCSTKERLEAACPGLCR